MNFKYIRLKLLYPIYNRGKFLRGLRFGINGPLSEYKTSFFFFLIFLIYFTS